MTWDDLTWEQKRGAVLAQALFACEMCDDAAAVEVDHIWPRSKGGTDDRWNLRATCRPCNRRKADAIYLVDLDDRPWLLDLGARHGVNSSVLAALDSIRWSTFQQLMAAGLSARAADLHSGTDDQALAAAVDAVSELVEGHAARIAEEWLSSHELVRP